LADTGLAYKYADLQGAVSIYLSFTTLFLGVAIASGIGFFVTQAATKYDEVAAAIYGSVSVISLIVTVIFGVLTYRVMIESKKQKELLETDAESTEVTLEVAQEQSSTDSTRTHSRAQPRLDG
jgi:hypothetical protein